MKSTGGLKELIKKMSHPARGAWIEIKHISFKRSSSTVAPRKGCVD